MSDFLRALVEIVTYFWPFKMVEVWERGLYMVNGQLVHPWRWARLSRGASCDGYVLSPGLYVTLPWFTNVHGISLAWDAVDSDRIDLVLKDGRVLSLQVVALMRVSDPVKAYTEFYNYETDRVGLLRAAVADTLTSAEAERFGPEKRGRLLGQSLLAAVKAMGDRIGHEVEDVQVTSFILQPRAIRLLS